MSDARENQDHQLRNLDEIRDATGGPGISRRRLLGIGAVSAITALAAGIVGVELVSHGVLPGKSTLDEIDGACSIPETRLGFTTPGRLYSGSFYSRARHRTVGYSIGYPPGRALGDELALIVMLHGFGSNHVRPVCGMTPSRALSINDAAISKGDMAIVTVDGGGGYWNPHPGDDPMSMVINELIPRCQRHGLGASPEKTALMGISMGGYGALILAETHPRLFCASAAISPAIWTNYDEASRANPGAYFSASSFASYDAVTHASGLRGIAVRVASGTDDPFHPGVVALARALPSSAEVRFLPGCHSASFFLEQLVPSLRFLSASFARARA